MQYRLTLSLCFVAVYTAASWAGATEVLHEKDAPNLGINIRKVQESTWRSRAMAYPGKFTEQDRVWSGNDFFVDEFGMACEFREDWIKEQGYCGNGTYKLEDGRMVFTTGKKGFYFGFGPRPGDFSKPSLRFGCTWGPHKKDRYRVRMVMSQDVEETSWEFWTCGFQRYYRNYRKFKVRGRGEQVVFADIGIVRNLMDGFARRGMCGFKFVCTTPGATIRIKSIKIAPYTGIVYFRRKFNCAKKPVMAKVTFAAPVTYALYVNGREAARGTNLYPAGTVRTVDLLPYLKQGGNTIAFEREFFSWQGGDPEVLIGGVAIDRDGNITRIVSDDQWRCSLKKAEGWIAGEFDDSGWRKPKILDRGIRQVTFNYTADGRKAWTGVNPAHMGMIAARPADRRYPVFDFDRDMKYRVCLPAGVKDKYALNLDVVHADTLKVVKNLKVPALTIAGDYAEAMVAIGACEVGPYRLRWSLQDNAGRIVETRSDEMIIVGPIRQETFALQEFEDRFESRLQRVVQIDCAKTRPADEEFIDHAGMYNKPMKNKGRVVSADSMTYRETGMGCWDYFAYRFHLGDIRELGRPYLVEIVVPDNRDRYIYSGVVEQFPVGFCNNYVDGHRGRFTATGTCYTGVRYPLTYGRRKLRYVYWPGSLGAAVVVMSGFKGSPAAACRINIYKIKGGLPALSVPQTSRMFGSHNERMSVMTFTTGSADNSMMNDKRIRCNGNASGWYNWYKAIERKIRWLRFQGRNMTVEGVYMYSQGDYPSLKHNVGISNQEMDPPLLAIKMYNHNKINCMLGIEYMNSPWVTAADLDRVSDRKMRQGTRGMHLVDRYGRQLAGNDRSGINFLDPRAGSVMYDCIGEIYHRYESVGKVAGLFMISGNWWAPGFVKGSMNDIINTEAGYGDYTVGLFEKEARVNLQINARDPQRFQKRYELLMGRYRYLWLFWRASKLKQAFARIAGIIHSGKSKWPFYLYPTFDIRRDSPFIQAGYSRQDRDEFMAKRYLESGIPLEQYFDDPLVRAIGFLKSWAKFRSPKENFDYINGWNNNRGSREVIRRLGVIYLQNAHGLDEVDCPAGAAGRWLWTGTGRGVFVPRGVEDNCMHEFVNAMVDAVPGAVFYSWLDCNMETGFGAQMRRFSKAYYSTPPAAFTPLPDKDVKGVIAQVAGYAGKKYLRLINNTPYTVSGVVRLRAKSIRELVYDRIFRTGRRQSVVRLSLRPNDMLMLEVGGMQGSPVCEFALPGKTAGMIIEKAKYVLQNRACLEKVPGDMVAALFQQLGRNDAFMLYNLLEDFEVGSNIRSVKREMSGLANQRKLLKNLRDTGWARIICASRSAYTDPRGNQWLPDQRYFGGSAYGNEGANYADRGVRLEIEGTDMDRVYQTEAYGGHVFYRIPVPRGKYNVYLHFAETYIKNKRAGCRQISLKIEHVVYPQRIDPFALAGGWARAYVVTMKNVPVYDSRIDIELTGGVGINGIEIEMVK